MICKGCGGVIGKDCFNPSECVAIATHKAAQFDAIDFDVQRLLESHARLLEAARYAAGSFAQVPSDKTVPPIVLHDCREKLESAIAAAL
jgi:hypothetical protein